MDTAVSAARNAEQGWFRAEREENFLSLCVSMRYGGRAAHCVAVTQKLFSRLPSRNHTVERRPFLAGALPRRPNLDECIDPGRLSC